MCICTLWQYESSINMRVHHVRLILPVAVIKVLADEGVWLDSPINIHLRHVEVIYEVDKSLAGGRAKFTTSFLL